LTVDSQCEVSCGNQDALAGEAAIDADDVVTPADLASFVDRVDAGPDRSIDGRSWFGWVAGRPSVPWCRAVQGLVGPGTVVMVSPTVELVLQFSD